MENKIGELQQELYATLKKARRYRCTIAIARMLCYGGALVWLLGLVAMQAFVYSGSDMSLFYTLDPAPTFFERYKMLIFVAPLFVLIIIGGYGVSIWQKKITEAEQSSIRRIVRAIFSDVRLSLSPSKVSISKLLRSHFFGGMDNRFASGYSFGSVAFENDGHRIIFYDLLVQGSKQQRWLTQTTIGEFLLLFRTMFKGVFSKRVENITGNFRGMFANAQLEKKIDGSVVVLPDHLEKHLDYLAKNVQAMKNIQGNRLVMLEDPEFERHFAVYATSEITARYVLTPAMMLRITELRKKYDRQIMLSFNGSEFFFAVAMPEGFLTLGNTPDSEGMLSDLYDNFTAAKEILSDLQIS